jgi:hypothetical protein
MAGRYSPLALFAAPRNAVSVKEATARIKINKLLDVSGWRFFADGGLPAKIRL